MGQVKWTDKSITHLRQIHEFISRDSKTYADRYIRSLIQSAAKLSAFPECGRLVPELPGYNLHEIIYHHYRIVYRITDSGDIEIIAVVHGARSFLDALDD